MAGRSYAQTIGLAGRLEITWVSQFFEDAAVKFPLVELRTWQCVESTEQVGYAFASYRRRAALPGKDRRLVDADPQRG
ncbi:dihydrofolate reductase family protein [Nakamurella panacisegetis]|uniref:hypothetical protein n=1 Tax=Nakamurella panacisegetis TaxID=1090615 RepID=UPI000B883D71|nr:hypothetical protein [Nakamurella panacisegetis]